MSNYVYPNFLLLWDEKIIEAKTDNSVYSLYQSGKLAFEKDNETIILLDRKTPITQNENCGEYDDIQTQKALCQYHFLMEKPELPKDLLLNFIDSSSHKIWSGRDSSFLVADSIFGTYFFEYNGRVTFFGDHKNHNVDSARLIHLPNSTRIKSPHGYTALDIKKAVCYYHHLSHLIKLEMLGNPSIWEEAEDLVRAHRNFNSASQNK